MTPVTASAVPQADPELARACHGSAIDTDTIIAM